MNATQVQESSTTLNICDFTEENVTDIAGYAEEIHLQDLSPIFRLRMTQEGVTMKAAILDGHVVGYGTLRASVPEGIYGLYLYADLPLIASTLAVSLIKTQHGQITLIIQTPEPNVGKMRHVWDALGVKTDGILHRNILSTRGPEYISPEKIYAASRFEGHPM